MSSEASTSSTTLDSASNKPEFAQSSVEAVLAKNNQVHGIFFCPAFSGLCLLPTCLAARPDARSCSVKGCHSVPDQSSREECSSSLVCLSLLCLSSVLISSCRNQFYKNNAVRLSSLRSSPSDLGTEQFLQGPTLDFARVLPRATRRDFVRSEPI